MVDDVLSAGVRILLSQPVHGVGRGSPKIVIYPVLDPRLRSLGVHLTRRIDVPEIGPLDENTLSSWGHALGTLVLAALLYLCALEFGPDPRRGAGVVVALTASVFGIGIEPLQSFTGDREASVADALLNAAGAGDRPGAPCASSCLGSRAVSCHDVDGADPPRRRDPSGGTRHTERARPVLDIARTRADPAPERAGS